MHTPRTCNKCMVQHADDIVKSCAALCNLKPALIQVGKY